MKRPLDLDAARAIAADLCAKRNVALVYPGSAARTALIYAIAAAHALGLGGWDVDHARQNVTITMPAVGLPLAGLLAALPLVGPLLSAVADAQRQTTIYLSPSAASDPVMLLAVVAHEIGHADQIAAGGLAWCAAYGLVPEVRAGAESPCYGQDVAVMHALHADDGDVTPALLCNMAMESLRGYGLDAEGMALAHGVLSVVERTLAHGGELGGPSHDVLVALRERGVL